jgi:hypothetical protein
MHPYDSTLSRRRFTVNQPTEKTQHTRDLTISPPHSTTRERFTARRAHNRLCPRQPPKNAESTPPDVFLVYGSTDTWFPTESHTAEQRGQLRPSVDIPHRRQPPKAVRLVAWGGDIFPRRAGGATGSATWWVTSAVRYYQIFEERWQLVWPRRRNRCPGAQVAGVIA